MNSSSMLPDLMVAMQHPRTSVTVTSGVLALLYLVPDWFVEIIIILVIIGGQSIASNIRDVRNEESKSDQPIEDVGAIHRTYVRSLVVAQQYEKAFKCVVSTHSDSHLDHLAHPDTANCYLELAVALLQTDAGEKSMALWDLGLISAGAVQSLFLAAWPRHMPEAARWYCLLTTNSNAEKISMCNFQRELSQRRDLSSTKEFYPHVAALQPCPPCYSMFFRLAGPAGDVTFCENMLEDMRLSGQQPLDCHINSLLDALAKTLQPSKADAVYERYFRGCLTPNKFTYGSLINAWAKVGDVVRADYWLQFMISSGIRPNEVTYASVIHACARSANLPKAEHYAECMRELGLITNVVVNTILKTCAAVADITRAEYWMREMEVLGLQPDAFSFNTILSCCVKSKAYDRVNYWRGKMQENNIPESEIVYNVLLSSKIQTESCDRAVFHAWLEDMRAHGVETSASTFNIIIQASNSVDEANYWWLELLRVVRPNSISFNIFARILARNGDYLGVENLYAMAQRLHERLNEDFYSCLFDAYAQATPPQTARAELWYQELRANGKTRINKRLRRSLDRVFEAK